MHMHHPEIAINQTLACAVRKLSEAMYWRVSATGNCFNREVAQTFIAIIRCKHQAYPKVILFYYNKYFLFSLRMWSVFTLCIHKE